MTLSLALIICASLAVVQQTSAALAPHGYRYDRPVVHSGFGYSHPSGPALQLVNTGHHYAAPLATIRPVQAVPQLPRLPAGHPQPHHQPQTLLPVHTLASQSQSIASAYRPPSAQRAPVRLVQGYNRANPNVLRPRVPQNAGRVVNVQTGPSAPTGPSGFGQRLPAQNAPAGATTGSGTSSTGAATFPTTSSSSSSIQSTAPQHFTMEDQDDAPLSRGSFNQQAAVGPATAAGNAQNGNFNKNRPLHQYAVIEHIDNDIEQKMEPFLNPSFFDSFRAHIGASGTGALGTGFAGQVESRSNALVKEQQRMAQQSRAPANGEAVALGSGGLGFIRLPNGNVYLGSGSLGYISGQQFTDSMQDARTRTGAPRPDALHFGHGPYGHPFDNRYRFRF